ncbi:MAG: molybdopterin-binding protein [Candidatus Caldarchaeum sp.]|nr:molybdopterin-binding protein [Candidatus Caldarchaeum sp.]
MAKRLTVEIINVGNELLDGRTVNTNLNWLCAKLTELGYIVTRATTVRDETSEIANAVKEALARKPGWIIMSGGLGPTHDDKTLQAVAKALGKRLRLYEDVVEKMRKRYQDLVSQGVIKDPTLTKERLKMAKLPEGSKPLENRVGTAPGVLVEKNKVKIACLPGVPKEMMDIFENQLKGLLEKESRGKGFLIKSIPVEGIVESRIAPLLVETMKKFRGVYLKSNPKGVEKVSKVVVDFIAERKHEKRLDEALKYFEMRLSEIAEK